MDLSLVVSFTSDVVVVGFDWKLTKFKHRPTACFFVALLFCAVVLFIAVLCYAGRLMTGLF